MRLLLLLLSCLFLQSVSAQKIYGTVFNANGDLLPYASISIKGTTKGTSANDKAKYALNIAPGTYTFVCQNLGYASSEKKLIVKGDAELSFILTEQKLTMDAVVVKKSGEDPAYEIIRNAIKKRNYYAKQVSQFTCNIYGKDLIKLKSLPKKVFGKKIPDADRKEMGLDSAGTGIIYLSESVSKVSVQQPDKIKLEVMSSRVSGSGGFGFNFPSFISLYTNNVKVFTERFNPRGFVSPIADGAINFYKFKYLGTFFENGKSTNSILVTPRRKYEPLFSGIINIVDDEWSIQSFDLTLTKTSQLEIMDTLQITQLHVPVDNSIRRVKNQLLHFNFKQFGIEAGGNFLTVYSDYNVNPKFSKKYFDNVVIKYDTGVNKKTIAYWDSTRAVPLEKEEEMDYKKKDSIYISNKESLLSRRSIDSLNKNQPKIKPSDIFLSGIRRNHFSKSSTMSYGIEPLLLNAEYNPAEGAVVNLNGYISKFGRKSRSGITLRPSIRYGINNTHLNPQVSLTFFTREQDSASTKLKRYAVTLSGGKRVSEFNKEGNFSPLNNAISTLFYGKNYLKTYENYFGSIVYSRRFESGLRFSVYGLYENRIPLNNTTNFTLFKKDSINIKPNYPTEKLAAQFEPHKALIAGFTLSFKPGQKFIQFPTYKVAIGSKYPTFTLNYSKGISNVLNSDVNFDKWRFSIQDDKNLKLAGTFKYRVGVGGFLNNKKVYIQDFQHFTGNRILSASEYVNSFQLASYYANSTIENFYSFGHAEHHFNGLFTNKIPLFRKLNWNLVAGSNALYVNKNNNYVEVFGGLENIFKIFRVDFVAGYDQKNKVTTGIRLGGGGLLGGSISRRTGGGGGVNISL
jgi:hypothetical protein